jgi:hypothetical protein
MRTAHHFLLDAAMLVTERDLQMEHRLAMALEPKAARLDHARVNRADRDFVHLIALDFEIIHHAGQNRGARRAVPGIFVGAIGAMKTNRLEPGMAFRFDGPLLGDLAFKQVRLRAVGRQRGIALANRCRGQCQHPVLRLRDHRV